MACREKPAFHRILHSLAQRENREDIPLRCKKELFELSQSLNHACVSFLYTNVYYIYLFFARYFWHFLANFGPNSEMQTLIVLECDTCTNCCSFGARKWNEWVGTKKWMW